MWSRWQHYVRFVAQAIALGACRVLDALLGEAIFGCTRQLLVGSLRAARGCGRRLASPHEASEPSPGELLVGSLGFARFVRYGTSKCYSRKYHSESKASHSYPPFQST